MYVLHAERRNGWTLVLRPFSSDAGCYQNEQNIKQGPFWAKKDSLHMLIVAQKSVSRIKQRNVRTWLSIRDEVSRYGNEVIALQWAFQQVCEGVVTDHL